MISFFLVLLLVRSRVWYFQGIKVQRLLRIKVLGFRGFKVASNNFFEVSKYQDSKIAVFPNFAELRTGYEISRHQVFMGQTFIISYESCF
jgi:hypothetical protein